MAASVGSGVARGRGGRWTQWLQLSMVRAQRPARMAGRMVVEGVVPEARYGRAAVLHRLLPHRESTLAAELYRCEPDISADPRGRVHRGAGAARVAGRPRDGAADGADLPRVS